MAGRFTWWKKAWDLLRPSWGNAPSGIPGLFPRNQSAAPSSRLKSEVCQPFAAVDRLVPLAPNGCDPASVRDICVGAELVERRRRALVSGSGIASDLRHTFVKGGRIVFVTESGEV
jgi:hypothetical protein